MKTPSSVLSRGFPGTLRAPPFILIPNLSPGPLKIFTSYNKRKKTIQTILMVRLIKPKSDMISFDHYFYRVFLHSYVMDQGHYA